MTTVGPGVPAQRGGGDETGGRGALVALTIGTVVLGACNYLYLALVGNVVGVVASAPVSVLWTMMAGIAVGLFQPVEQMLSRGIARDHDLGRSAQPVVRRTLISAAVLLLVTLLALLVAARPVGRVLFSGDTAFVALFAVGLVTSTVLFAVRGVLAGSGRFRRYGVELTVEGLLKVAGAAALALGGATDPRLFGAVLVVSPLVATGTCLLGLPRRPAPRRVAREVLAGPAVRAPASSTSISSDLVSLGALTTGSLLLQLFVNVGVVLAQMSAAGTATAYTASLVAALAVARVPLFLFNAVQSLMLTRFTVEVRRGRFRALSRALVGWNALVLGLGVVWVLLIWSTGDVVLTWFGDGYGIPSGQLVLLAVSCVLQIVTMVVAQALLAFHRERLAMLVWPFGLVVLLAVFGLSPVGLGAALSLAMVAGTAATALAATGAVLWSIRRAGRGPRAVPLDGDAAAPVLERP